MVDFASAQNITGNAGRLTRIALTLELVVMRIVNNGFNTTCYPVERAVITGGTEHLVASANLENTSSTFGASARLCIDEFRRCEIVGVARMLHVLFGAFHFVAILTSPHIAKVTLPLSAEKSATICLCIGARSYKSGALLRGRACTSFRIGSWTYTNAIVNTLFFGCDVTSACFEFGDFGGEFRFFISQSIFALDEFSDTLACRKKRLFLLEHNRLAVFFPILCDEFLREIIHKEFARKFFVTFHTIGNMI